MQLEYFNIGFRCENSINALKELSNKKGYNQTLLEDAYEIINYCDRTINGDSVLEKSRYWDLIFSEINILENLEKKELIEKVLENKKKEIIETKQTLEDILNNKEVPENEVNSAIAYFTKLSGRCVALSIKEKMPRVL